MRRIALILFGLLAALSAGAQTRKVQNRPYIDQRRWHYGFLVGMHVQDCKLVNTGLPTEDGEVWFADQPEYAPGFTVGVLGELYLHRHLSLRLVPSLHFGERKVVWREQTSGEQYRQTLKTAALSVPVDLKFSAERFNNYRPYIMAGLAPSYDFGVKKGKALLLQRFDCMLELGLGCDFYLPFFKLIPELKFCFGLSELVDVKRTDLTDASLHKYAQAVESGRSRMIVLTFYFE